MLIQITLLQGLNPCSNGRCSASGKLDEEMAQILSVLILVLMEDALRDTNDFTEVAFIKVLILVLMEDALRDEPL